ncbi:histidine kinase dimerization/phosphoacceptor domain -containing protein [Sphingomonas sp. KR1UV-12]|uniref:histidine kinase n=1 Tax=Sphingomonas aurea TaxID=3063994 RepID=A0ABT9ENI4_9SPHN|nr:histidine kinase dimerization/phosphoacceptor domain -containing protein [Sphingomonas sp. KR1UV-12]MDP1028511.1 histidine kinase dimerization/phosphoacceptor domain -containing protein [Sphingomonas sp. KR1UV-12]
MASQSFTTDPRADLTGCDREPIHVPGSIQPHGLLLIADARTLMVVAGAGDLEARIGADWLGTKLPDLLGQDIAALLEAVTAGPGGTVVGQPVTLAGERFDVAFHRAGDLLLVELEPSAAEPIGAGTMLGRLDLLAQGFERASDLQGLCDRAAIAFRQLTGFDRVMVYRFLDDDAGRVVAEDRDPALGTFLHHHFPASDIPRQARALYVRNRARAIPNVDYLPQPIRPESFAGTDLSDVGVRSVSPIHLQYLRNMGVEASASISIVKDGLLWGLIACHHNSPRALPADVRQAAATLASSLARQVRAREEAETYRERLRLRAAEDGLVARLADASELRAAVERTKADLRTMLGADGFALVDGQAVVADGVCPPDHVVVELAAWARLHGGMEPFATHELATLRPAAAVDSGTVSGLLAVPLIEQGATLLWFRVEQVEEIEWAGNPHKAVALTPGATLSPRASFATWSEAVRGRSRRWTLEEIEGAYRLRRTFQDACRSRELRDLNAHLNRTLADKDALLVQKDLLMKEVDHRIQNSLQLVGAFLAMQARAAGPGTVADQLIEAQARLSAVALVHRRLYRDDQIETIDLSRYLEELVGDMKASLGAEWGRRMKVDLAPVLIPTDRAVNIGLVMTELVINATKYAYAGAPGPISIALEQHRNRLRLIVADEGGGKSGVHSGFGSRMMTAVVSSLDGEMLFTDNAPGLRAILTAPLTA